MNLNDTVPGLITEARALRAEVDDARRRLEPMPDNADTISAIFLSAHAVNGPAGHFILDQVVFFSRSVQGILDSVQRENQQINATLAACLYGVLDQLGALIEVLMLCDLANHFDRIEDFSRIAQRLLGTTRYKKLSRTSSLENTLGDALEQLGRLIDAPDLCEPAIKSRATPHSAARAH